MASFVMDFRFFNINLIPFINSNERGLENVFARQKCVRNGIDIFFCHEILKAVKAKLSFFIHVHEPKTVEII